MCSSRVINGGKVCLVRSTRLPSNSGDRGPHRRAILLSPIMSNRAGALRMKLKNLKVLIVEDYDPRD